MCHAWLGGSGGEELSTQEGQELGAHGGDGAGALAPASGVQVPGGLWGAPGMVPPGSHTAGTRARAGWPGSRDDWQRGDLSGGRLPRGPCTPVSFPLGYAGYSELKATETLYFLLSLCLMQI